MLDLTRFGATFGTGLSSTQMRANRTALADATEYMQDVDSTIYLPARLQVEMEQGSTSTDRIDITESGNFRLKGDGKSTSIIDVYPKTVDGTGEMFLWWSDTPNLNWEVEGIAVHGPTDFEGTGITHWDLIDDGIAPFYHSPSTSAGQHGVNNFTFRDVEISDGSGGRCGFSYGVNQSRGVSRMYFGNCDFYTNSVAIGSFDSPDFGLITVVAKSGLADGDAFVLYDDESRYRFVYNVTGSYTVPSGSYGINISSDTSSTQVRNTTLAAINATQIRYTAANGSNNARINLEPDFPVTSTVIPDPEESIGGAFAIQGTQGACYRGSQVVISGGNFVSGRPASETSDDDNFGGTLYIHPNRGLYVTGAYLSCPRTAARQYTSSGGWTKFGGVKPSVSRYKGCTFEGCQIAIITPDAPVKTTIENCTLIGTVDGAAEFNTSISVRCDTDISGCTIQDGATVITSSETKMDEPVVNIEGCTIRVNRNSAVIVPDEDWTLHIGGGTTLTLETGVDADTQLVSINVDCDVTIDEGCVFTAAAGDLGYGVRIVTPATGRLLIERCTFTGGFLAGLSIANVTAPADIEVNWNDFSGITNGRGITLSSVTTSGNDILTGQGNLFPADPGIRLLTCTFASQQLRLKAAQDSTTRTPSAGALKVTPNYLQVPFTGAVTGVSIGLGNDLTHLFQGDLELVAANASSTITSGATVTSRRTAARRLDERISFSKSGTVFTERLITGKSVTPSLNNAPRVSASLTSTAANLFKPVAQALRKFRR